MDKPPLHLICDGLPSDDLKTDYILRTANPASLWRCSDTDDWQIHLVAMYENPHPLGTPEFKDLVATTAREVGRWYLQYQAEEEELADA